MEDKVLELVMEELKYIRGSGDLLRAEFSTRMDKQDVIITEIQAQTRATNGRVNKLDARHSICPITTIQVDVEALKLAQKANDTETKVKDTDEYKAGKFLKTTAITAGWVIGIGAVLVGIIRLMVHLKI